MPTKEDLSIFIEEDIKELLISILSHINKRESCTLQYSNYMNYQQL